MKTSPYIVKMRKGTELIIINVRATTIHEAMEQAIIQRVITQPNQIETNLEIVSVEKVE